MAFPGSSMPFKAPTKDDPVTETSREFCDDGHVVDFSTVYDIGEKLGSGTFGNVHRCTHRITGKQHAVKTIILTSLTPHQKARSLDEARICQMLDHENVVRLHRLYQDDRSLYFVMELVCGGELFEEIVSREHYSEQDASDCMRQVFSAICHCHKLRIVHRDLKPENILLSHKPKSQDEPVVVKLADFGLAIKLPDGCNNVSVSICGTPGYIAPETLRHQPIGTPVDLWACGVLLYILLV
jgi:calcium/calmodulin-dependent protein kinase (CaM kinase) II